MTCEDDLSTELPRGGLMHRDAYLPLLFSFKSELKLKRIYVSVRNAGQLHDCFREHCCCECCVSALRLFGDRQFLNLTSGQLAQANERTGCEYALLLHVQTFGFGLICSYLSTFCCFRFTRFLAGWRRQQTCDALVEDEEEGDAFGVGRVGFFAAAGLIGSVYGGVYFLVGLE